MAELEFWSVRAVNWCEMRSLAQAPHPNDAYLNAPLGQGAMDGVGFVLVLDVGGRSQPPAAGDESRRRGASVGESDKPVVHDRVVELESCHLLFAPVLNICSNILVKQICVFINVH